MRNLLIIYPHWPPSNLAGVHRPRLISNFINEFGWHPIVLTIRSEFYEEKPDEALSTTIKSHVEVIKTKAFRPPGRIRLIGDLGLRGFPYLYLKAKEIIKSRKIDAIWIPVPNYYTMALGRLLNNKFKMPFGIDYIDPWFGGIPGSDHQFTRAWLSNKIAGIVEPWTLKKASFLSGVNTSYYQYIFNKGWVSESLPNVGMPYGFDPSDHEIMLKDFNIPWQSGSNFTFLYAGAFLPKARIFLEQLFEVFAKNYNKYEIQFVFIGTGSYTGKTISEYASEFGIEQNVMEIRERFSFLHILNLYRSADACFLLGSTEPHYTASKTFQMILSGRPILSILHQNSSANQILKEANADRFSVKWKEEMKAAELQNQIKAMLSDIIVEKKWTPSVSGISKYSARESARSLAKILNKVA